MLGFYCERNAMSVAAVSMSTWVAQMQMARQNKINHKEMGCSGLRRVEWVQSPSKRQSFVLAVKCLQVRVVNNINNTNHSS
jgi:hypothetical protein